MARGPSSEAAAAYALLAVVLAALSGCAGGADVEAPADAHPTRFALAPDHEAALVDGERLRYSVTAFLFEVGEIRLDLDHADAPEGRVLIQRMVNTPVGLARLFSRYGGTAVSSIDARRMEPVRYHWHNPYRRPVVRRYDEFEAGGARGLEVEGEEWDAAEWNVGGAQDPVSMLALLRVIDVPAGESVVLDLIEGRKHRLLTIRGEGTGSIEHPEGTPVACRRLGVRVDRLDEGRLTGEPAESDFSAWFEAAAPHTLLLAEGKIGGAGVTIRLEERRVEAAR